MCTPNSSVWIHCCTHPYTKELRLYTLLHGNTHLSDELHTGCFGLMGKCPRRRGLALRMAKCTTHLKYRHTYCMWVHTHARVHTHTQHTFNTDTHARVHTHNLLPKSPTSNPSTHIPTTPHFHHTLPSAVFFSPKVRLTHVFLCQQCVLVCLCVSVWVCERERERERERETGTRTSSSTLYPWILVMTSHHWKPARFKWCVSNSTCKTQFSLCRVA